MVWEKILNSKRKISKNLRIILFLIIALIAYIFLIQFIYLFVNHKYLHNQLAYVFPTIIMLSGVGIPIIISALNYDDHDFSDIISELKNLISVAIFAVILNIVLYLSENSLTSQEINKLLLWVGTILGQYGMSAGYALFILIYIFFIFLFFNIVRSVAKIYFGSNLERYAKRFKKYAKGKDDEELKNLIKTIRKTIRKRDEIKLREISPIIDGLLDLDGDDEKMLNLVFPASSETSDSMLELIYEKINNDEKFIKSILEQLHDLEKVRGCNDLTFSYFMCGIKHLSFGDVQKIKIINDYMCDIIMNVDREDATKPLLDINMHETGEISSDQTNYVTPVNLKNEINFTHVLPHIMYNNDLCSLCSILESSKDEMTRFTCKLLRNYKVLGMPKNKIDNVDATVEFLLTKGDHKLLEEKCIKDLIALRENRIELIPEDLRKRLDKPSISNDVELQVTSKVDDLQSDLNKPSL